MDLEKAIGEVILRKFESFKRLNLSFSPWKRGVLL